MIARARPHLILEQQPSDMRCIEFLREREFVCIDVNSYRQVHSPEDFPPRARNPECFGDTQVKTHSTPYSLPVRMAHVKTVNSTEFTVTAPNCISARFKLEPGRYLMNWFVTAEGTDNNMMCGVRLNDRDVFRYHAYSKLLCDNYRDWVVELPSSDEVQTYFQFREGTDDPSFRVDKVDIYRIDGLKHSLWAQAAMI